MLASRYTYTAPYWVHLFTTLPLLLLTCIPPLRPLKGWLVASQYIYKAEEGRLVTDTPAEDKTAGGARPGPET